MSRRISIMAGDRVAFTLSADGTRCVPALEALQAPAAVAQEAAVAALQRASELQETEGLAEQLAAMRGDGAATPVGEE
jgi:hypothetical protein